MTHPTEPHPYIPTDDDRDTYEQLQIERGEAILEDEARRYEWAQR